MDTHIISSYSHIYIYIYIIYSHAKILANQLQGRVLSALAREPLIRPCHVLMSAFERLKMN